MHPVIMAGGTGTRLWPISRRRSPKQGQPFGDRQTLLQKTYLRLLAGWKPKDIFISTSVDQYGELHRQLPHVPRQNYILETSRRDTAAAIGLAAVLLHKRDPKAIMCTANSDAFVKETTEYIRILKASERVVQQHPNQTVLVGIKPRFPDTGLGYIKMKQPVRSSGTYDVFSVDRFVEKPNVPTAKKYVTSGRYLWNPAMFVFRVDALLEKYHRWLPNIYRPLMKIHQAAGTARQAAAIKRIFPTIPKISIDYGIMEHDRNMLVVPTDMTWSDIGNWSAVYDMLANDEENVEKGLHVAHDSKGNIIFSSSDRLIATAGLRDMIVIDTPDATLICPRNRAQDVRALVAKLEQRRLGRYL